MYTYKNCSSRERIHSLSRKPSNPGRGGAENCTVPRISRQKPKQVYPPFFLSLFSRLYDVIADIEINGQSKSKKINRVALRVSSNVKKKKMFFVEIHFLR